jgi:hypothetical protein
LLGGAAMAALLAGTAASASAQSAEQRRLERQIDELRRLIEQQQRPAS